MAVKFVLVMALFLTVNVNGLRDPLKRLTFGHWLSGLSADVVCLQELHCVSEDEVKCWFPSFSVVASVGSHKSCGVAVIFRTSFTLIDVDRDSLGRFVRARLQRAGSTFDVVSLYAPNLRSDRVLFFPSLLSLLDVSVPTLLCGDFNSVMDPGRDRRNVGGQSVTDTSDILVALFRDLACVDIWRSCHPSQQAFTWLRPDGTRASRIDLIGCPVSWLPSVSSCEILACPISDHSAVSLALSSFPGVVPRGPGFWKLNTSVCLESDYISLISSFWSDWQKSKGSFSSLLDWWDLGKVRIKSLSIDYCRRRSAKMRAQSKLLSERVAHLKSLVDLGHVSALSDYRKALSDLQVFSLDQARGAQVRARARWVEEGESSTSYFLRLEKKRKVESTISSLKVGDRVVSSTEDLLAAAGDFYKTLYSSCDTDPVIQEELLSNLALSLSSEEADSCEGDLTVSECLKAVQGMAKSKTPGLDGLPAEFYLAFWSVLGPDLVQVLNHAFRLGFLSVSQRRGLINLVFKADDRTLLKNWRPISLLCVDYKIGSRAIAGRLLRVIDKIVHPDQSAGVPGRFIGENVAYVRDAIQYASTQDLPLAILTLDQEKAFDRVEWEFLFCILERMGFGPSFCKWVQTLYTGVQSSVIVNGFLSKFFNLHRGVRQGCPLSPLLYVLVAETLAAALKACPRIKGLSLPAPLPSPSFLSQYADDTSILVTTDDSILAVFEVFDRYELGSGARLNLKKCKGLWVGAWRNRQSGPVDIRWSSVKLRCLGSFLGPGDLSHENWDPRIQALKNLLFSWRQRNLTFQGRALIINALGLSGLWYLGSVMCPPSWVISEINTEIFSFFWSGKKDKVSRNVVCQPKSAGGFGVVDIATKFQALHVAWVHRLCLSSSAWTLFFKLFCLGFFGDDPSVVLAHPAYYPHDLLPAFYSSMLCAWGLLGGHGVFPGLLFIKSGVPTSVDCLSVKLAYSCLLSSVVPHCVGKFRPLFGDLYWPATWSQVHVMPFDRHVADFSWLLAHGVVLTANRLRTSFRMSSVPPGCFCGAPLETVAHLFFECPLAQSVFAWVQSLLVLAVPSAPSLCLRHVLFGFDIAEFTVVPRVFVYLINLAKHRIWLARNDFRFRNRMPSAVDVIAAVRSQACFILRLWFRKCARRFFVSQWGASGVIASVCGDDVRFNF